MTKVSFHIERGLCSFDGNKRNLRFQSLLAIVEPYPIGLLFLSVIYEYPVCTWLTYSLKKSSFLFTLSQHHPPNKPLSPRALPKMCNLVFQQNSKSLFDFFKTFLFFHSHSSDSIGPEKRHVMKWREPHMLTPSNQISSRRKLSIIEEQLQW